MAQINRSMSEAARARTATGKWMDSMDDHTDATPNAKVLLIATGAAALGALLIALARRGDENEPADRVQAAVAEATKDAKKAGKAAKRKQKELASALQADAETAERELKAAAWDAQQRAREAEGRLRAAGLRVVDDAAQLASRVSTEARSLAGEGRERISQLRHREEEQGLEADLRRLREEVESLQRQLRREGRGAERDFSSLGALFGKKGGPVADALASPPIAAALAQVERSLRAKAPALAAAKNKSQVLDILMQDIGPTMRDAGLQAFAAALGILDTARTEKEQAREALEEARDIARKEQERSRQAVADAAEELRLAAQEVSTHGEAALANGKRRFWRGRTAAADLGDGASGVTEEIVDAAQQSAEEERHGKAGLFWGGAGIGLALYALLDAERREKVLRLANDASVQIQELVSDLQGYDDEF
jgi:hypothetical protein